MAMFTKAAIGTLILAISVSSGSAFADDESADVRRFANEPGWEWWIEPISMNDDPGFPAMSSRDGIVILAEEGKGGDLFFVMSHPGAGRPIAGYHRWRAIAIDVDGARQEFVGIKGIGVKVPDRDHFVFMDRLRLKDETLRADRVAFVGVEGLTLDGAKALAAEAAEKARAHGLTPLPYVEVGQPFAFALTDIDGRAVESQEFQGSVVLIDLWATWCPPCMAKMPHLKELYAKWHHRGLEVIGFNGDEEQQSCRDAVSKLELPWRQCMVPTDEVLRELWFDAMGGTSFPRLLLIDRKGHLRADCSPDDLENTLVELMEEPN